MFVRIYISTHLVVENTFYSSAVEQCGPQWSSDLCAFWNWYAPRSCGSMGKEQSFAGNCHRPKHAGRTVWTLKTGSNRDLMSAVWGALLNHLFNLLPGCSLQSFAKTADVKPPSIWELIGHIKIMLSPQTRVQTCFNHATAVSYWVGSTKVACQRIWSPVESVHLQKNHLNPKIAFNCKHVSWKPQKCEYTYLTVYYVQSGRPWWDFQEPWIWSSAAFLFHTSFDEVLLHCHQGLSHLTKYWKNLGITRISWQVVGKSWKGARVPHFVIPVDCRSHKALSTRPALGCEGCTWANHLLRSNYKSDSALSPSEMWARSSRIICAISLPWLLVPLWVTLHESGSSLQERNNKK